jgi:HEAT repeat protein
VTGGGALLDWLPMPSPSRWLRAALLVAALGAAAPAAAGFDWIGQIELDAEGLRSEDAKVRLEAVTLLSSYDVAHTQARLLPALRDADPSVRHEAGRVLGRGKVAAAAPIVIEWLADVDAKTRAVAAEILGELGGDEATSALVRTLGDVDAGVRLRAVSALGRIGKSGQRQVVVPLISRLEDDKSDVRREAIQQLTELGDRRAVIPMVAAFGDTSLEVRKAAVRAVGLLGDRAAVPALTRLVSDPAEEVRTLAVAALGNLGAADAVDALIDLMATGSDAFRAKVAYALGQIAAAKDAGAASELASRHLVTALAQPTQKSAAIEALRVAGKAAVPPLVAHLEGRIAGDPGAAVDLLREAGDPRATAALVAELDRGRVPTARVLEALGATGDRRALVPVLGLLSSPEPAVRLAAMTALRPLIGTDARTADVLQSRLADEDGEVRILAAEYLGLSRSAGAVPALARLTGPGHPPRLRLAAVDALGEIGDARATPALLAALRDGPPSLHRAAASALGYVADPAAIPPLLALIRADRGPTRHHAVRALGGTARGTKDARVRAVLDELATGGSAPVALAAIAGLAALGDPGAAPGLLALAQGGGSERQRAAVWALGELRVTAAVPVLAGLVADRDDRLAGDAAWALGEIAAGGGAGWSAVAAGDVPERLALAIRRGGWATAIDAAGALARLALAAPAGQRPLTAPVIDGLALGLHHASRAVRSNAAIAIGASGVVPPAPALTALVALARDEASPWVREAALAALADCTARGVALPAEARGLVPARPAKAAPVARREWRSFYVVDPEADDAAVRQEPYFLRGADRLVWATYTDARGEITTERFPAGPAVVAPRGRENEY